jgi:hypothetical protein
MTLMVLVRGTTVKEAARKIMGDAPIAYIEGAGGVRIAEDEIVTTGKNDVSNYFCLKSICPLPFNNEAHRFYPSRWDGNSNVVI